MYLKTTVTVSLSLLVLLSLIQFILTANLQFKPIDKHEDVLQEKGETCCIPPQLETTFIQVGTLAWHPEGEYKNGKNDFNIRITDESNSLKVAVALMSYDYTNGLVAVTELTHSKPVKMIFNFNEGNGYFIYGEHCWIKHLKEGFHPMCVPADSTFEGSFNYGFGANTVNLDAYLYKIPVCSDQNDDKCRGLYASIDVTPDECMISSITIAGKYHFRDALTVTSLVNATAGIADPSIFNPPASCKQTDEEHTPDFFKYMIPKF